MEPGRRRTTRLTTTSMRAYGISCGGAIRCTRAAPTVLASKRCLASWGYCNSAEPRRSHVRESAVKPVGKPDALIGHVRFDERGWETGRRSWRQCSRPSSTLQTWTTRVPFGGSFSPNDFRGGTDSTAKGGCNDQRQ